MMERDKGQQPQQMQKPDDGAAGQLNTVKVFAEVLL